MKTLKTRIKEEMVITTLRIKLDDGTKIVIEGTEKEVKRIEKFLKQIKPKKEEK